MSFTGHLEELRSCLIKSSVAVMIAFLGCYAFADALFSLLTEPILRIATADLSLIGTGIAEAFFTKLKVAFIASLFVALPVILWQLWRFIAPGLYEHERQYARYFVFFGTVFFLMGAWFCYEVVFRFGYRFFLEQYEAIDVRPTIRIGEYLSFSAKLLLAFGITFELPIAAFFLARVGMIDHHMMIRQFRYAILVIFIIAAILTPPDVISQILLAMPLTALYAISIAVAYFARRRSE